MSDMSILIMIGMFCATVMVVALAWSSCEKSKIKDGYYSDAYWRHKTELKVAAMQAVVERERNNTKCHEVFWKNPL